MSAPEKIEDVIVKVPVGLINGILSYLGTRPYTEVAQIITAIANVVTPQIQGGQKSEVKPDENPKPPKKRPPAGTTTGSLE